MPRSLTATTVREVFKQQTGEAWLVLLTLDHPDLASPLRVTSDGVDTISRGDTFQQFPFSLALPHDAANELPAARLEIDNVDRQIVEALRSVAGGADGPTVLIEIVRGAAPDTLEAAWPDFRLAVAPHDELTVAGELTLDLLAREPYPADSYTPATAPGVFG